MHLKICAEAVVWCVHLVNGEQLLTIFPKRGQLRNTFHIFMNERHRHHVQLCLKGEWYRDWIDEDPAMKNYSTYYFQDHGKHREYYLNCTNRYVCT